MLFAVIMTKALVIGLTMSALAVLVIRMRDGNWQTIVRLVRLLRWFVIPILLLHMLFTPGTLLFPGFPIGISREGAMAGISLSLHLIAIYLVAIMLFRLLHQYEWLQLCASIPGIGRQLALNAMMMISLKQVIGRLLGQLRDQFQIRLRWQQSPLLLIAAFRFTLQEAACYARMLWLRWPESSVIGSGLHSHSKSRSRQGLSLLWGSCGAVAMVLPWLS